VRRNAASWAIRLRYRLVGVVINLFAWSVEPEVALTGQLAKLLVREVELRRIDLTGWHGFLVRMGHFIRITEWVRSPCARPKRRRIDPNDSSHSVVEILGPDLTATLRGGKTPARARCGVEDV
jgi:hypothetical protein